MKDLKKDLVEANSKLLDMTVRAKKAEGQVASLQNQVASLRAGKNVCFSSTMVSELILCLVCI